MIIDPISHLGLQLTSQSSYEPELTNFFRQSLKSGDSFVDVGANEGYFSVLAGTLVKPNGRVIAVEPQSRLQRRLKENAAANDLEQFEVVSCAISDHRGKALLHLTPDMNSGASGLERVTRYRCRTQEVETITLEELLDRYQLPQVQLMKMDIEGFEYEAIFRFS